MYIHTQYIHALNICTYKNIGTNEIRKVKQNDRDTLPQIHINIINTYIHTRTHTNTHKHNTRTHTKQKGHTRKKQ
jgi:hypothetical protein